MTASATPGNDHAVRSARVRMDSVAARMKRRQQSPVRHRERARFYAGGWAMKVQTERAGLPRPVLNARAFYGWAGRSGGGSNSATKWAKGRAGSGLLAAAVGW